MKIESGKYYKTRDGRKVGPMCDAGYCYYEEGKFSGLDPEWSGDGSNTLPRKGAFDLIAEWTDATDDAPKLWRDMTPSEKGALLLADHDGKEMQAWVHDDRWEEKRNGFPYHERKAYRVKPADPVVETVTLAGRVGLGSEWSFGTGEEWPFDSHRITFQTIDGKPDCDSIRMEEL